MKHGDAGGRRKLTVLMQNSNSFEEQPENLGLAVSFTHAHVRNNPKAV